MISVGINLWDSSIFCMSTSVCVAIVAIVSNHLQYDNYIIN